MAKLNSLFQPKISLIRVVSNYTPSVVIILILFVLSFQFLDPNFYSSSYLVELLILYVGLIILEIVLVYTEFKGSVFLLDNTKLVYRKFSYKKGIYEMPLSSIMKIDIINFNIILEDDKKQRLIIDYLNRPKLIKKEIEKRLKKKP
jgi:hypothetical protein